jgi:hypothetical protein
MNQKKPNNKIYTVKEIYKLFEDAQDKLATILRPDLMLSVHSYEFKKLKKLFEKF